jgi:uncharacterized protein (UPF0548 family)
MYGLTQFTADQLNGLATEAALRKSFPAEPGLAGPVPFGFHPNPGSGEVGRGVADFERGKEAVRSWRIFPEWVLLHRRDCPIAVGEIAIAGMRVLGIWAANACRIVEVIDEPRRYGFVYATCEGHALRGAERFLLELKSDGRVTFEIFSISRPAGAIAWFGLSEVRRIQKRFARDAITCMRDAIAEGHRTPAPGPTALADFA